MHILQFITAICCLTCLYAPVHASEFFDTHLHYDSENSKSLSPLDIIRILTDSGVNKAVITSEPPALVMQLHELDPERIVPMLGVYRNASEKFTWMHDSSLPGRLAKHLNNKHWAAIGELHIFARDRHSSNFSQIIKLAAENGLAVMLHTDPAVIDTVFEIEPRSRIIWAHAGAFPYPDLLDDYLNRYPGLYLDLSVREERIMVNGNIDDAWYELIINHSDRILLGVDTFSTQRWYDYGKVASTIRKMVEQFPKDIQKQLLSGNAKKLFIASPTP